MSTIGTVLQSILCTRERHGHVSVCYVSDDEYLSICQEHVGGPWFGAMTIGGVPIKPLSQICAHDRQSAYVRTIEQGRTVAAEFMAAMARVEQ